MQEASPVHASPRAIYPGLDFLRLMAMLMVFFRHLPAQESAPWYWGLARHGWIGVDLFFVISGYLIAFQVLSSLQRTGTPEWRVFYAKRCSRILPLYWLVLLGYFCLPWARESECLPPLWKFLTFTQNYGLDFVHRGTFSHAWSLCVEEQFYLVLPWLCWLGFRYGRGLTVGSALVLAWGLSCSWRLGAWHDISSESSSLDVPRYFQEIYFPTHTRLDALLLGLSLALVRCFRVQWWARMREYSGLFLVLGLLLVLAGMAVSEPRCSLNALFGFPLFAMGFACLVMSALSPGGWLAQVQFPGMTALAGSTYAVYLVHKQTIHLSAQLQEQLAFPENGWQFHAMAILSTWSFGWVLTQTIGQPILRLRDRWLHQHSSVHN
ncbi:acyltransferase [bacterium]|nr:acyltransferase [bacterium]